MQGSRVQSLGQEILHDAEHLNLSRRWRLGFRARAPQLLKPSRPGVCALQQKPTRRSESSPGALQPGKSPGSTRPSTTINEETIFKIFFFKKRRLNEATTTLETMLVTAVTCWTDWRKDPEESETVEMLQDYSRKHNTHNKYV